MIAFLYSPTWGQCGVDYECTETDWGWLLSSPWGTVLIVVAGVLWFGRDRDK